MLATCFLWKVLTEFAARALRNKRSQASGTGSIVPAGMCLLQVGWTYSCMSLSVAQPNIWINSIINTLSVLMGCRGVRILVGTSILIQNTVLGTSLELGALKAAVGKNLLVLSVSVSLGAFLGLLVALEVSSVLLGFASEVAHLCNVLRLRAYL